MQRKWLIVSLILAVALGGAFFWMNTKKTPSIPASEANPAIPSGVTPILTKGEKAAAIQAVTIVADQGPVTLDPVKAMDVNSYNLVTACHAPLALVGQDGKLVLVIAKHMQMATDGLKCEIELSDNAKFWTGEPVTAKDVVYTFNRLWAAPHPHKWVLGRIEGALPPQDGKIAPLTGFQTDGDRKLTVRFSKPDPDFCKFIASGLTSIVKEGSGEAAAKPFDVQVVGCGAFAPGEFIAGDKFEFKRNLGYVGKGGLEKLTFKVIDNPQNQLLAYRNGTVDLIRLRGPMIGEALELDSNGGLKPREKYRPSSLKSYHANELAFVLFNWDDPSLASVAAGDRRAFLAQTWNQWAQKGIVAEKLYLNQAQIASGVVPAAATAEAYKWQDAATSVKALPPGVTLIAPNDPDSRRIANALESTLKAKGSNVQAEFLDLNQVLQRLLGKKYAIGGLWVEQQIPAGPIPWMMFFDPSSPFVVLGQPIKGLGDAIDEARGTLDDALRISRYNQIVSRVNQEQSVMLPMLSRDAVVLHKPGFSGVFVDANGVPYWMFLKPGDLNE